MLQEEWYWAGCTLPEKWRSPWGYPGKTGGADRGVAGETANSCCKSMESMTFLLSGKTPLKVVFAMAAIITFAPWGERGYGNVTRLSKIEWILADYKSFSVNHWALFCQGRGKLHNERGMYFVTC